jgi:ketosteroid isomerase-like protein
MKGVDDRKTRESHPENQAASLARDKEAIRRVVKAINEAWSGGRVPELESYFHEDITIVAPDLTVVGRGREACVGSYADFVRRASTHEFKTSEPDISVWGMAATAAYSYEIEWEAEGQRHKDMGKEVFVFIRESGRWRAVCRLIFGS